MANSKWQIHGISVHLYYYSLEFAQPAQISRALAHRLFAIGHLPSLVLAEPRWVYLWFPSA
jgi:hypothetical protein